MLMPKRRRFPTDGEAIPRINYHAGPNQNSSSLSVGLPRYPWEFPLSCFFENGHDYRNVTAEVCGFRLILGLRGAILMNCDDSYSDDWRDENRRQGHA